MPSRELELRREQELRELKTWVLQETAEMRQMAAEALVGGLADHYGHAGEGAARHLVDGVDLPRNGQGHRA